MYLCGVRFEISPGHRAADPVEIGTQLRNDLRVGHGGFAHPFGNHSKIGKIGNDLLKQISRPSQMPSPAKMAATSAP